MRFGVIGCGYVGMDTAIRLKYANHHVVGTTRSKARLGELQELLHGAHRLDITESHLDLSFTESLNGLLISVAPTMKGEGYSSVFARGIRNLTHALRQQPRRSPLHITYISSAGLYGNQEGALVTEESAVDTQSPINALLGAAEELVLDLSSDTLKICVLRLGGIYGPGRDMVSMIRQAAGQQVSKYGNAITAWSSIVDITRGIQFAYENQLEGIYNLVDDMQLSRRELSTTICDLDGLPPVIWSHTSSPTERNMHARVSNSKLKKEGFQLMSPSMLTPVTAK